MWNKRTQKTKLICHGDFESGDMTNVKNQAEMREVATARKTKINGMGNLKRKKAVRDIHRIQSTTTIPLVR